MEVPDLTARSSYVEVILVPKELYRCMALLFGRRITPIRVLLRTK